MVLQRRSRIRAPGRVWRLLLAALLLLLGGTVLLQAEDAPPGQLENVADTALHVFCLGQGAPAVVFEAGLGGNYLDWSLVQPLLAKTHRTCAYDRAGAGWSARTERPRNAQTLAEELHDAMQSAGVPTPFVLVGHSFGGLLGQSYVRRYPADVAGLVLVDSMHPDQVARFSAAGVDLPTDPHLILGRTPVSAAAYGLPEAVVPLAIRIASASKVRIFAVREMMAMPEIAAGIPAAARCGVPTRVLVHGKPEWDEAYPDGRMERAWRDMQRDLAARFCAPPPTIVAGSGHEIALDTPQAVVDAIEALGRPTPP